MRHISLDSETDFDGWRDAARGLLAENVPPEDVFWGVGAAEPSLFDNLDADTVSSPARSEEPTQGQETPSPISVPRKFVELAQTAILHSDPGRFDLLYRLLWRQRTWHRLMHMATDPDVARAEGLAKSVRRDIHKMHAFVRFREIATEDGQRFVAWFEPEHHIVAAGAEFFVRRFPSMRWSILTPRLCAHWDLAALTFSPAATRGDAPGEDAMEEVWRTYYASIFNPARLKVDAMRAEMPKKYWRNLPEASLIEPLIRSAGQRTEDMVAARATEPKANPQRPAAPALIRGRDADPEPYSLAEVRAEAADCRNCPLWEPATQTVFGEGPADARVMFVGEQPGDKEDLAGRPFVGPAGQLFDRAMGEAGIDRSAVYVTNAVKHFKFVPRGKARIHSKPGSSEIQACRPWLARELELVGPQLVVAMGATAVQSVFGKAMPIGKNRGRVIEGTDRPALITVHPSYLLRLPDPAQKAAEYAHFVEDLRLIAPFLQGKRHAA